MEPDLWRVDVGEKRLFLNGLMSISVLWEGLIQVSTALSFPLACLPSNDAIIRYFQSHFLAHCNIGLFGQIQLFYCI